MDELLKMLIEAAEKEGKVHVIKKTVNKDNSIERKHRNWHMQTRFCMMPTSRKGSQVKKHLPW